MSGSGEGSRPPRQAGLPWCRIALALMFAPAAALVLFQGAPQATAVAAADLTPSPSLPAPTPAGGLQVTKTNPQATVRLAGARFNLHRNTQNGPVVATLVTGANGTDTVRLTPGMYCLEETAAPAGYQLAPTYTPASCEFVVDTVIAVEVADPPNPTPTPARTPVPTPVPTAIQTGELQVVETDPSGRILTTAGFTFNISLGTPGGQVIATVSTNASGIAVAGALNPATYCVTQTAVPDGFTLAPVYAPSACVAVTGDPTQGRNPTTITVADQSAASPTPTDSGAAGAAVPSASAPPPTNAPRPAAAEVGTSSLVGTLAKVLVAFGLVLLAVGGALVLMEIRRRRRRVASPPAQFGDDDFPPDVRYDSTIT